MRYFLTIFAIVVVLVVAIAGTRGSLSRRSPIEIFPDMDRQLKLRPQTPNGFFANGRSSQPQVAGTIARSTPIQTRSGSVYPYEDHPVNTGRIALSLSAIVERFPTDLRSSSLKDSSPTKTRASPISLQIAKSSAFLAMVSLRP